jgi:hypothetical protein
MKRRRFGSCAAIVILCLLLGAFLAAPAGANTLWFDEYGNSSFGPATGYMVIDQGPGGLSQVLNYDIGFSRVPGDVLIMEGSVLSDVIRFDPNFWELMFYSDNTPPHQPGVLADTGLPTEFYPNPVTIQEVGSEKNNWVFYTPLPGQPGYSDLNPGLTYQFISDVPVPPSVLLFGGGLLGLLGLGWRRRS